VLEKTRNDVKLAILVQLTGLDIEPARAALAASGGFLRRAIDGAA
jgi:N-acetylmuramic acid 6-phosphate etherase